MMQSEQIAELANALMNAQGAFETIGKGRTANIPTKSGGQYSYTYADLGDIVRTILPTLKANGLAFTQLPSCIDGLPALNTTLMHISGQWISETMLLHIDKADAQGQGSALTYARRYALSAVLGIVTESDDDGAGATQSHRENRQAQAGEVKGEIGLILKAAELDPGNTFLVSLATQYLDRGTLTGKQIESGAKSAQKIIDMHGSVVPSGEEVPFFDE